MANKKKDEPNNNKNDRCTACGGTGLGGGYGDPPEKCAVCGGSGKK